MRRFARAMAMTTTSALALGGCDSGRRDEAVALAAQIAEQTAALAELTRRLDELEARNVRAGDGPLQASPAGASTAPAIPEPTSVPGPLPSLKCDDNWCTVARAEWDAVLDDPSFLRQARLEMAMEEVLMVGVKVHGIRPDTPLAQLGLKDGDTVRSIEGVQLTSISDAFEVPAKVRGKDLIFIEVAREGRKFDLAVEVKD